MNGHTGGDAASGTRIRKERDRASKDCPASTNDLNLPWEWMSSIGQNMANAFLLEFVPMIASKIMSSDGKADETAAAVEGAGGSTNARPTLPAPINPLRRDFSLHGARVDVKEFRVVDQEYASYRLVVSCKGQTWSVWKRFSDFEHLRESLVASLELSPAIKSNQRSAANNTKESASIPSLPPKTLFKVLTPKFLEKRSENLQTFMREILKRRELCNECVIRVFLDACPIAPSDIFPPSPVHHATSAEGGREGDSSSRAVNDDKEDGRRTNPPPSSLGPPPSTSAMSEPLTSPPPVPIQFKPIKPAPPSSSSAAAGTSSSSAEGEGGEGKAPSLTKKVNISSPFRSSSAPPTRADSLQPSSSTNGRKISLLATTTTAATATPPRPNSTLGVSSSVAASSSAPAASSSSNGSSSSSSSSSDPTTSNAPPITTSALPRPSSDDSIPLSPSSQSTQGASTPPITPSHHPHDSSRPFSISPEVDTKEGGGGGGGGKGLRKPSIGEEDGCIPPASSDKIVHKAAALPAAEAASGDGADVKKKPPPVIVGDPEEFKGMSLEEYAAIALPRSSPCYYDCGPENTFHIRGKHYTTDSKKVPSGPPIGKLVLGHVFKVLDHEPGRREDHIASRGVMAQFVQEMSVLKARGRSPPFLFILNFQVPGDPPLSLVFVFALPVVEERIEEDGRFWSLFEPFIDIPLTTSQEGKQNVPASPSSAPHHREGEFPADDFRNKRFKLIPSIVDGPSMVRWAVGAKPTLLGQKLTQRYFRGPNYFEIDVDIASSVVASQIVSLCRGYAKYLKVEIGIVLQGENEETELPEKLLGTIGIDKLHLLEYCTTDFENREQV